MAQRPLVLPEPYDGVTGSWTELAGHFEKVNKWESESLVALNKRFNPDSKLELYVAELRGEKTRTGCRLVCLEGASRPTKP